MQLGEILINRIRDFEVIFRCKNKISVIIYIILRQFLKTVGIDEKKIANLIKNNSLKLYGYRFLTREKTLDFLHFSKFREPQITKFIMKFNGNIFLDIGAHLGRYSIIASKNFKKIYAFEPHPENFKMLRKNIKINRIKNVVPIKIALSNKNGKVFLSDLCMDTGHVKIVKKGKIIAFVSTLNRIMRKMKISPKDVDLVKIDVEGEEENIIKGATTLLKKGNPILIIECRPEKMEKLLLNYGYHKVSVLDYHNAMFSRTTEKDLSLKV